MFLSCKAVCVALWHAEEKKKKRMSKQNEEEAKREMRKRFVDTEVGFWQKRFQPHMVGLSDLVTSYMWLFSGYPDLREGVGVGGGEGRGGSALAQTGPINKQIQYGVSQPSFLFPDQD